MSNDKPKDGISVKEIENFAKKFRFEVFFCLSLILACFFSFVFFTAWSIILSAVGGIAGLLVPAKVEKIARKMHSFCAKQEQITQLVLGIVLLVLSIFLPFLPFLLLGAAGGKYIQELKSSAIDLS